MADCPLCDDEHPRGSAKCPGQRVGKEVAGRYVVKRLIGVGAAGAVYEANRKDGNAVVALKMLRKELSKKKDLVERFQREARSAAAVQHPGFVRVGSLGEDADGTLYLEMELLVGTTLDTIIASGPLKIERAVNIACTVLDALDAAHAQGIVHRDMKPENIFITSPGEKNEQSKVLDLGIAKVTAEQRMTKTGEMLGTPAYMSPEQMRSSANVDARGDIYAVGAILFEMLTHERVIKGHIYEVMAMVVQGHVKRSVREFIPNAPEWLENTVTKSLAFNPDDRFQTAKDMKLALQAGSSRWWKKLWPFG